MTISSTSLESKFENKKILIVGAGVTGTALVRTLSNYKLFVTDDNPDKVKNLKSSDREFRFGVVEPNQNWAVQILDFDIVIPSPGIPKGHEIIQAAIQADLVVLSEIEVGYLATSVPIVAITGTNGKTTVTTLVDRVLSEAGLSSIACGNIGTSLIECVAKDAAKDVFVAEVSSFQLNFTESFKPKVAAWLNFSEDHLDWHSDLADYADAKSKIFKNQTRGDFAVLNIDDPVITESFRKVNRDKGTNIPEVVTFGINRGNFYLQNGEIVCSDLLEPNNVVSLISLESLQRRSKIDILNFLAVLAICLSLGVQPEAVTKVLSDFRGLPHRIELFLTNGGISWINDSKATTPASVVAALESLHNVILILGGKDKGLDFSPIKELADHIEGFVFIGDLQNKLNKTFSGCGKPIKLADSMKEAVVAAYELAESGDTVLLSPGGTSFDWYKDYKHRGDDFKLHVQKLISELGHD